MKYGEENWKGGKFENVHYRTWNKARKLKIMENEKHPVDDLKNEEIKISSLIWLFKNGQNYRKNIFQIGATDGL